MIIFCTTNDDAITTSEKSNTIVPEFMSKETADWIVGGVVSGVYCRGRIALTSEIGITECPFISLIVIEENDK